MANKRKVEFPLAGRRVWVAGHGGMVGSAITRRLAGEGCDVITVGRGKVDLRRQDQVEAWMAETRPEVVFVAAATVGGILANDSRPVDFLYDNLVIETNIIQAAHQFDVAKLLFLGSSCIYPKMASQPITEDALLTGPLEPTNQWYAVAKIAGIKLCQAYRRQYGSDFISAMPTNLYGPGDNFDLRSSHVMPALINKAHRAKVEGDHEIELWGSGRPRREFLHVDDCADAVVHLMMHYSEDSQVNVGTGQDIPIADLARLVCEVVGVDAELRLDTDKPDGPPRKLLDVSRLAAMGWKAHIDLRQGIAMTYDWFLSNAAEVGQHVEVS